MTAVRKVSLFRNGANQAVRIPKEYELQGTQATLRQEGSALIIEPILPKSLIEVLAELSPMIEDTPIFEDAPPEAVDL